MTRILNYTPACGYLQAQGDNSDTISYGIRANRRGCRSVGKLHKNQVNTNRSLDRAILLIQLFQHLVKLADDLFLGDFHLVLEPLNHCIGRCGYRTSLVIAT